MRPRSRPAGAERLNYRVRHEGRELHAAGDASGFEVFGGEGGDGQRRFLKVGLAKLRGHDDFIDRPDLRADGRMAAAAWRLIRFLGPGRPGGCGRDDAADAAPMRDQNTNGFHRFPSLGLVVGRALATAARSSDHSRCFVVRACRRPCGTRPAKRRLKLSARPKGRGPRERWAEGRDAECHAAILVLRQEAFRPAPTKH